MDSLEITNLVFRKGYDRGSSGLNCSVQSLVVSVGCDVQTAEAEMCPKYLKLHVVVLFLGWGFSFMQPTR